MHSHNGRPGVSVPHIQRVGAAPPDPQSLRSALAAWNSVGESQASAGGYACDSSYAFHCARVLLTPSSIEFLASADITAPEFRDRFADYERWLGAAEGGGEAPRWSVEGADAAGEAPQQPMDRDAVDAASEADAVSDVGLGGALDGSTSAADQPLPVSPRSLLVDFDVLFNTSEVHVSAALHALRRLRPPREDVTIMGEVVESGEQPWDEAVCGECGVGGGGKLAVMTNPITSR